MNCSRFVVITSQRSGSRYFMDKLKSHASIRTGVEGQGSWQTYAGEFRTRAGAGAGAPAYDAAADDDDTNQRDDILPAPRRRCRGRAAS